MSKHKVESVDEKAAVEFLATTLREMKDAGLMVAIKNVTARGDRPAGIIIFCGNISLTDEGLSFAVVPQKQEMEQ